MNCNNLACNVPSTKQTGVLNPSFYKSATGFCPFNNCGTSNTTSYTTRDARLVDSARAMQTYLNAPPYDGSVWMDNVYDPQFVPQQYNVGYSDYNILPGQIMYYIDPATAPAFRRQIYNIDGTTEIDMFKTPMDAVDPMFYLVPDQVTFNNISKDTFARDQLLFRNELTALQQRGHNKQRYQALK